MEHPAYERIEALARDPESLAETVAYAAQNLQRFVKRQERVLICYSNHHPDGIGGIMEQAVRQIGGIPMFWGPDYRWKALLRQAFASKATVIVGPPLIVLGLCKLARYTTTPLYIHHVLLAGYPSMDWMIDGIKKILDCETWGCYGPGAGSVISGFSCGKSLGVHLREDMYTIWIEDEHGNRLPDGAVGEVMISPNQDPSIAFPTMERGRLDRSPCPCGCTSPRLMEIGAGGDVDRDLARLGSELQSWTSILDCRMHRGDCGLELEIVTFPGEKLPKLPSCAKLVVRPWDPDTDMPFWMMPGWENPLALRESN